jgi:hypothetical protein
MVTLPPKRPTKAELKLRIAELKQEEEQAGIPENERMPLYQLEFIALVQILGYDALERKKLQQRLVAAKSKSKKNNRKESEGKMGKVKIGGQVPAKDCERIIKKIAKKHGKGAFLLDNEKFEPEVKVLKA